MTRDEYLAEVERAISDARALRGCWPPRMSAATRAEAERLMSGVAGLLGQVRDDLLARPADYAPPARRVADFKAARAMIDRYLQDDLDRKPPTRET